MVGFRVSFPDFTDSRLMSIRISNSAGLEGFPIVRTTAAMSDSHNLHDRARDAIYQPKRKPSEGNSTMLGIEPWSELVTLRRSCTDPLDFRHKFAPEPGDTILIVARRST